MEQQKTLENAKRQWKEKKMKSKADIHVVKRNFYQDRWNEKKVWEVATLVGGLYLRQYIDGVQYGRGARTTKKFIRSIGILGFQEIDGEIIDAPDKKRKVFVRREA